MKKSDMNNQTTYLLCPNKLCTLFFDNTHMVICEENCPHQEELRKLILCQACKEIIILSGAHNSLYRVDHNCANGKKACNFQRMSGFYRLIHKFPD